MSPANLVVRLPLLLAVTPLLLGSCGPAKQGKVASIADSRGREVARVADVTILDPGEAPRTPLRYRIGRGQSERLVMDVGVMMKLVVGEMGGSPRYTVRVTMDVQAPAGSPRVELEGKLTKVEVLEEPGVAPATVAALRSDLDRMAGLGWKAVFSDLGHLEMLTFAAPADANPQLANTVDWVRDGLRVLLPPLPQSPVGKNARWQAKRSVTIATAHIDETSIYKLGADHQLAVTLGMDAQQQTLTPHTPPGTVVTLSSFEGGGKGQIELGLDHIVQPTTLRWAASGKGTATPAGEPPAPLTLGLEAALVVKRQ